MERKACGRANMPAIIDESDEGDPKKSSEHREHHRRKRTAHDEEPKCERTGGHEDHATAARDRNVM